MDLSSLWMPALTFGVTVVLTFLLARLAGLLIPRAMRQSKPQVAASAAILGSVIIWLIGGVVAVQELGISPDILLLIAALAGVAALIATREQLENVGAKYFSDVYGPYKVGDSIRLGTYTGKIIEINAMTTVLLSEGDQLISIPNALFMSEVMVNTSPQAWKEVAISVTIGANVDLAEFEAAVLRSLSKLRSRLDRRFPPLITTRNRTVQAADLTVTVMIRQPEDRELVLAEVTKRILEVRGKVTGTGPKASEASTAPGSAQPPSS
jgi:small conductance mechanosensitive channel